MAQDPQMPANLQLPGNNQPQGNMSHYQSGSNDQLSTSNLNLDKQNANLNQDLTQNYSYVDQQLNKQPGYLSYMLRIIY